MPSPKLVSLTNTLETLRAHLIVRGKEYDEYTPEDHTKALGFRVLASAHIEDYAEQRCVEVAEHAVARMRAHRPSRTARSLLIWQAVRRSMPIPLESNEFLVDAQLDEALRAYKKSVEARHGVSASNVVALVHPLGVGSIDEQLIDKLTSLATARGQAAHVRVNRAKSLTEPEEEWREVREVLRLLGPLDDALGNAVTS